MPLGRKVDDVAGIRISVGVIHQHLARENLAPPTGSLVNFEVGRERSLELQCNPPAHDTNAVDAIDKCLRIFCQEVASLVLDQ